MSNSFNIYNKNKLMRYLIYGLFIFSILFYIPQTKLCFADALFITMILLFFIYFFEHFNNKINKKLLNRENNEKEHHNDLNKKLVDNSNKKLVNDSDDSNKEHFDNSNDSDKEHFDNSNDSDKENSDNKLKNKYNNDGVFTKSMIDDIINDFERSNKNIKILHKLQDISNTDEKFKILMTIIETNINKVKDINKIDHTKIIDLINDLYNKNKKVQDEKLIKYFERNVKENESKKDNTSCDCESKIDKYLEKLFKEGKYFDRNGILQNVMNNDMRYNQLTDSQIQPLGSNDMTMNNSWENDYVLLNTDKWKVPISSPYKCKQEKECPICPSLSSGYPVNLKDFNSSRKIMPPDNINIDYIKDKLNSGSY